MDAEQIVKMTPETIQTLVDSRCIPAVAKHDGGQRREDRWPFPGTVEVWLPEGSYGEQYVLGTLHNLSPNGLAMRSRRPIANDTKISLAIHEPDLSCYGHAVVRHCTRAQVGYLIGVEFCFYAEEESESEPGP